jgi:hypothetical protein
MTPVYNLYVSDYGNDEMVRLARRLAKVSAIRFMGPSPG